MEQRKLIQHGPSSLTLSIPSKWLKERKLKKGDSLFVEEEGSKIILSTKESVKLETVSIDVSGLDRTSTLLYIMTLYRFGYNQIEVKFKKPIAPYYRKGKDITYSSVIHQIVNRCIGAEIVEQTDNKVIIKYLAKEEIEDFRVVLRRIFLLVKETSQTFLDSIKDNNSVMLQTVEEKYENVNKFVSYCLRLLNKYGYPDVKKTSYYYHIIASLDELTEVLKFSSRETLKYKKSFQKESVKIITNLHEMITNYYEFFYKFDLSKMHQLSQLRSVTKEMFRENTKKLSREELMIIIDLQQMIEMIMDLADFRLGLEQ